MTRRRLEPAPRNLTQRHSSRDVLTERTHDSSVIVCTAVASREACWQCATWSGLVVWMLWVACASLRGGDLVGYQSCGASGCHGAVEGVGPAWASSHQVWSARDPHAWAGVVLHNETSQRIVAALDAKATKPQSDAYKQVLAERCISCHVTSDSATDAKDLTAIFLAQGVSCESCHGAAAAWLEPHTFGSWPERSPEERISLGMRETANWISRVEVCAKCHVGSYSQDGVIRDVNHDLIAAGHPPLRFDAWLYTQNMPRHWETVVPETRFRDGSTSNVQQFESGRWIAVAVAAELDEHREAIHNAGANRVPWPELASYDCFACHHAMETEGVHAGAGNGGYPEWNAWLTAGMDPHKLGWPRLNARGVGHDMRSIAVVAREEARVVMMTAPNQGRREFLAATDRSISDWNSAAMVYLYQRAALADCKQDGSMSEVQAAAIDRNTSTFVSQLLFSEALNSPAGLNLRAIRETQANGP